MNRKSITLLLMLALAGVGVAGSRPLTPVDVVNLEQASDPRLSPNGKTVIYDVRTTDYAANKYVHSIWLLDLDGAKPPRRLAASDGGASNARWSANGNAIYFISDRSGSQQIWKADADGRGALQVTHLPLPVGVFKLSPDGTRLVVSMSVFTDCESPECTVERHEVRASNKASGQVFDRLFVRQDYEWEDGTRNHLFALQLDGSGIANAAPVALMPHFDGDCPRRVWGSDEAFDISPDGRNVYFSAQIAGKTEGWSTNVDIWRVAIDGKSSATALTFGNFASRVSPTLSPDGRYLAYRAQIAGETPIVARYHIEISDLLSGATRELAADWDVSPTSIGWSSDGRSLVTHAQREGANVLFRIDLRSGKRTPIAMGGGSFRDFAVYSGGLIFTRSSFDGPSQIYRSRPNGREVQLTHLNAQALADVKLAEHEPFSFSGWNGETVHGFVFKPYNYEPGHKYPIALVIHGGPEEAFTDAWDSRWNPQAFAGAGFAVVMINPHGSTSYGQAFTDSVNGHWGDRPLEDLQTGWAYALAKFSYLDGSRACALGPSYGGYMVNWIAGSWQEPWRCLVTHDGIFDHRMQYYASDIAGFLEQGVGAGGAVFDHPEDFERFNPVNHVAHWSIPMLIIHSGSDYRVPFEQGLGAFTALQRRGVPSRLLYFPDEIHIVLKPQNIVQWSSTIQDWLGQWTSQ